MKTTFTQMELLQEELERFKARPKSEQNDRIIQNIELEIRLIERKEWLDKLAEEKPDEYHYWTQNPCL